MYLDVCSQAVKLELPSVFGCPVRVRELGVGVVRGVVAEIRRDKPPTEL